MIVHADADAFFASVEERDDARLRGRPFVVGEQVVACPSYAARRLGVPSGWSTSTVRRRWPGLIVVPLRPDAYADASDVLFRIFRAVAPVVEPGSMEEAFLDIRHLADEPVAAERVAVALRQRCRAEAGLPVSAGVGRTKLMAKLASRRAKPDGLVVIPPEAEASVRAGLSLEEIWGVGPRTRARLERAGLTSLPAIAAVEPAELQGLLGVAMGRAVHAIAHGTESAQVRPPSPPRSVSRSRTVSPPSRSRTRVTAAAGACLARIREALAEGARDVTRVEVRIRLEDGAELIERSTATTADLERVAVALLERTGWETDGRGVALVVVSAGVAVSAPA